MELRKEWFVRELGEQVVLNCKERHCEKCQDQDYPAEVLSFGIRSKSDAEDASAVFFWCSCGHKWIEEPKPFVEQGVCKHGVFVGGMAEDVMCGLCEGPDDEE